MCSLSSGPGRVGPGLAGEGWAVGAVCAGPSQSGSEGSSRELGWRGPRCLLLMLR